MDVAAFEIEHKLLSTQRENKSKLNSPESIFGCKNLKVKVPLTRVAEVSDQPLFQDCDCFVAEAALPVTAHQRLQRRERASYLEPKNKGLNLTDTDLESKPFLNRTAAVSKARFAGRYIRST